MRLLFRFVFISAAILLGVAGTVSAQFDAIVLPADGPGIEELDAASGTGIERLPPNAMLRLQSTTVYGRMDDPKPDPGSSSLPLLKTVGFQVRGLTGSTWSDIEFAYIEGRLRIAGLCDSPDGRVHVFTWANRVLTDRGALPSSEVVDGYQREFIVTAMSALADVGGIIIGENPTAPEEMRWKVEVFRWSDGKVYELRELERWAALDSSWRMNNTGLFLGAGSASAAEFLPPYHPSNLLNEFVGLGRTTLFPTSLSDNAWVSGFNGETAFAWHDGDMFSLGTLPGGSRSIALNVNETGDVLGLSDIGILDGMGRRVFHPVAWSQNGIVDLAELIPAAARAMVDITMSAPNIPTGDLPMAGGTDSSIALRGHLKTNSNRTEGHMFVMSPDGSGNMTLALPVRENGQRFYPTKDGEDSTGISSVHAFINSTGQPALGRLIASVTVDDSDKNTGRIRTFGKHLPAQFISNRGTDPIILEARQGNFFPRGYELRPGIRPIWKLNGQPIRVKRRDASALASIPRDQTGRFETSIEVAGETAWSGVIWIID